MILAIRAIIHLKIDEYWNIRSQVFDWKMTISTIKEVINILLFTEDKEEICRDCDK